MPKTPIDYSKAVIYSIVCKTDETLIYVGSTTEFTKRKYKHKSVCNNENSVNHNNTVYVMIRANGGWDNFDMKPMKEYNCDNKIQLIIEEERIRKEMQANLNTNKAYLSPEERKENNKELYKQNKQQINEHKKKYREANTTKIAEAKKKYYEANTAKIAETKKKYNEVNAAKIAEAKKKYNEANIENIAEHKKKYYQANKERIAERRKKRYQERKNAL
jgi:hypothetical protein